MDNKITLEFDDEQAAEEFRIWWLDCGGEQGSPFNAVSWTKDYMKLEKWEEEQAASNEY